MPAIVYPALLPPPQTGWSATPRERAARSSLQGDPKARRRSSDLIVDVQTATWTYTQPQMAIWWPFYRDTLLDGQLWFTAKGPGSGGLTDRVMRYRPLSVRITALGVGIARVTADMEIRGRSEAPIVVIPDAPTPPAPPPPSPAPPPPSPAPPPPPGDLDVDIEWDASPGATSYTIKMGPSPAVYTSSEDVGNVTSATVPMDAGVTYFVAVFANNALGESPASEEMEFLDGVLQ
jgi:hypothetical protein